MYLCFVEIDNKFDLRQFVYLITDEDQRKRIITAIIVQDGVIKYEVSCGPSCTVCYDYELTDEEDITLKYGLTENEAK